MQHQDGNGEPVHQLDAWAGGVRVRLESDRPLDGLPSEFAGLGILAKERTLAEVACRVVSTRATHADAEHSRSYRWRWDEAGGRIWAGAAGVRIRRTASGDYEAEVESASHSAWHLVPMVAQPVLIAESGAVMHAAGAEVGGEVVLFVGPSGAGKSTAVSLWPQARLFAIDRAAVFEDNGCWWAATLPGGNPLPRSNPASALRCAPLSGVLEVDQGYGRPKVRSAQPVEALAILRRAALAPDGDKAKELHMLTALAAMAESVPVGRVTTVIGTSLDPALGRWLGKRKETR